jgi:alpha-mannosidase
MNSNGQSGVFADYRYYGVGDMGGAPREEDVQMAISSVDNEDSKINVILTSSSQMYEDITPQQKEKLPRYTGELMLTEHSSGVLTSQAYMKRWNRKNEQLADAAERAAVWSDWLGVTAYPSERLQRSWQRVLASQMHDILPGTTLPKGYEYAWNDEILAANGFAAVLTNAMGGIGQGLDTRVKGQAVVVYNPLSIPREDVVSAVVRFEKKRPKAVRVYDYNGNEVPSQMLKQTADTVEVIFLADLPAVGAGVYDVRPSSKACPLSSGLQVKGQMMENAFYRVDINDAGDIAQVYDKTAKRNMLTKPARLEFHQSIPKEWPAWNMDWKDRQLDAIGYVDGPAEITIVESGPVRATIEVTRQANNSIITQRICLSAGDAGKRVEIVNDVDWQSSACVLKAAFPLTVSNPKATYTEGLGTIQRGNNHPKQYEVLSHEWFDLTDVSGDYGVSILEDCKFGSDKPSDDVVRLSLLYTPGARHMSYMDQQTQDWGRHEFVYALYGHTGSWQDGLSEYQGRRLNQPLRAFQVAEHAGKFGRVSSMLRLNTQQVDVRAIKKAEEGDWVVVRLQELLGKDADGVTLSLGGGIESGYEIDGQERRISEATIVDGQLMLDMGKCAIRSFALKPAPAQVQLKLPESKAVELAFNTDAFTRDGQSGDGAFGTCSIPAELVPASLECGGIPFVLGNVDAKNAIRCQGQTVTLPKGRFNRIYLLAAADEDTESQIRIGKKQLPFRVQKWTGTVGQYDRRVWDREFAAVDYNCVGWLTKIETGFIKRDEVAWFGTHRHDAAGINEAYQFSYLFKYGFDLPKGAGEITLPDNEAIKVFAVAVANDLNRAVPVGDLYDNFDGRRETQLRKKAGGYEAGKKAAGTVDIQRADSYGELTLQPLADDYADQQSGNGVAYTYSTGDYSVAPKRGGSEEKTLLRLNDGQVGRNHDDLEHCTYFDAGEGRILIDLQKPVPVAQVNTFSWHRSKRAPQKFSLWAGPENVSPRGDLYAEDGDDWTLVATVNSSSLGQGGVHASSVSFPENSRYRYLMLITNLDSQGTFFNEIDVIASPSFE